MCYTGMIHPLFMAPFMYYQADYMRSVLQFRTDKASVQAAKRLKKKAYMPFVVLLTGFMLSTAFNRHQKRKENAAEKEAITSEVVGEE